MHQTASLNQESQHSCGVSVEFILCVSVFTSPGERSAIRGRRDRYYRLLYQTPSGLPGFRLVSRVALTLNLPGYKTEEVDKLHPGQI